MPSSEINFVPDSSKKVPNIKDQIFQWVIKNGKRIVIITQAIVLIVFISRFKFDTDIRNLNTEIEQNQAVVENLADVETAYLQNQEKLGLIKPIIERQIDWDKRLTDFTAKIPNDLTLATVKFSEKAISITAGTKNAQSFQIFVNLLVKDQTIRSAVLQSSQYDTEADEYKFVINMEL